MSPRKDEEEEEVVVVVVGDIRCLMTGLL